MGLRYLLGILGLLACTGGMVQARAACQMERANHYACDRDAFAKRLAEARVVRVTGEHMDVFAMDRTGQMVTKLGKRVAAEGETADMTMDVRPVDRSGGINYGPTGAPLGTLKVYDAGHELLWVETLDGNPDLPWQADVVQLLNRFQADAVGEKI